MVDPKGSHCPTISYRPIQPLDLAVLEKIHGDLFPIRYEPEFFLNVVHHTNIVSWGAVDRGRSDGRSNELIGFVTARVVAADQSEQIGDMLRRDSLKTDKTLVYILTLGVVKSYRNLGIASVLVREAINYAANIVSCRGVYLHVIAYNKSAIGFYKKMSFNCARRLENFYYINGHHYDAYLFVYYVNGGRSPCSPLDLVATLVTCLRNLCKSLTARLRTDDEKRITRWSKFRESTCLLLTQNKRIISTDNGVCQYV
ncbi:hypothetical protein Scep_027005 [Stephania cephalantha]|uniref:N-alpha-acetyltransferase 60 n=1 Tax=Stephania cephalantha TaxID=152367 RepID=A0AAP0HT39_9MAGN